MSVYNLDQIVSPDAIAVMGASEEKDSVGTTLMLNIIQSGFTGNLFSVNPW